MCRTGSGMDLLVVTGHDRVGAERAEAESAKSVSTTIPPSIRKLACRPMMVTHTPMSSATAGTRTGGGIPEKRA
jgi:hypothetical protein